MVKVDVFVPGMTPFEQQELNRAQPHPLDIAKDARSFLVKSPETSC